MSSSISQDPLRRMGEAAQTRGCSSRDKASKPAWAPMTPSPEPEGNDCPTSQSGEVTVGKPNNSGSKCEGMEEATSPKATGPAPTSSQAKRGKAAKLVSTGRLATESKSKHAPGQLTRSPGTNARVSMKAPPHTGSLQQPGTPACLGEAPEARVAENALRKSKKQQSNPSSSTTTPKASTDQQAVGSMTGIASSSSMPPPLELPPPALPMSAMGVQGSGDSVMGNGIGDALVFLSGEEKAIVFANAGRICLNCNTQKTPLWRNGPLGPKTLCNACGVRFKLGKLTGFCREAIEGAAEVAADLQRNGAKVESDCEVRRKSPKTVVAKPKGEKRKLMARGVERSVKAPKPRAAIQSIKSVDRTIQVCSICEWPGEVLQCNGPCRRLFHPSCLGQKEREAFVKARFTWQCSLCTNNVHACQICHAIDTRDNLVQCELGECSRFYHLDCLCSFTGKSAEKYQSGSFICPLHTCARCHTYCRRDQATRCMRCPTAYHIKCAPPELLSAPCRAGLGREAMVCSRHPGGGGRGGRGKWSEVSLNEPLAASLLLTFQGRRDGETTDYRTFPERTVSAPNVTPAKPEKEPTENANHGVKLDATESNVATTMCRVITPPGKQSDVMVGHVAKAS
mmetsp:Transcript_2236/g.7985  ORF Transcript_2236/g.7985 Transcript_2236/m.7985 type:complete len:624 (+) Transcript_2236:287-2158(+)